jgi:hypothetical protein
LPKRIRNKETLQEQNLQFDRVDGEHHYFEHVTHRKTGSRLGQLDEVKGADGIRKRHELRRLVYGPTMADIASAMP